MAKYIDDVVAMVTARPGKTCRELALGLHEAGRHDDAAGISAALTKAFRMGLVVRGGRPYRYTLPPVEASTGAGSLDWRMPLPGGARSRRSGTTDRDRLWKMLDMLCSLLEVETPERPTVPYP